MYEMIFGLNVKEEAGYQTYREGMTPILQNVGGSFRYDFRVGETLKNGADHPINRVFMIVFPNETVSKAFFADPNYQKIRAKHFDRFVGGITQLS